jgi:hypothetical protein
VFLLHIVAMAVRMAGGLDGGLDGYFDVLQIGIGMAIRSFVAWLVLVVWLSELMKE